MSFKTTKRGLSNASILTNLTYSYEKIKINFLGLPNDTYEIICYNMSEFVEKEKYNYSKISREERLWKKVRRASRREDQSRFRIIQYLWMPYQCLRRT